MYVIALQSGSNGNCIYVEAGDVKLLIDAGISGSRARDRLAGYGRDISAVDALLISHDHVDHCRSMGVFHRKFGLPVYTTAKTHHAASRYGVGEIASPRHFTVGSILRFGDVSVETYATPHDAVEGVAFVVDDGQHRVGILTDLGHVFSELEGIVASLDAVVLESNYDPDMLANGSYPAFLKCRIEGPAGHLSNVEAAQLLHSAGQRMKWACLGHLSEDNNTPAVALKTHRRILGQRLRLSVASRYEATDVLEVT